MGRRQLTDHEIAQGWRFEQWRANVFRSWGWPEHQGNAQALADGYLKELERLGIGLQQEVPNE